jgi:hypothetical protein
MRSRERPNKRASRKLVRSTKFRVSHQLEDRQGTLEVLPQSLASADEAIE